MCLAFGVKCASYKHDFLSFYFNNLLYHQQMISEMVFFLHCRECKNKVNVCIAKVLYQMVPHRGGKRQALPFGVCLVAGNTGEKGLRTTSGQLLVSSDP